MARDALARKADAVVAAGERDPLAQILQRYRDGRYNLAAPVTAIDQVPPMHRVSVRIVTVNPEAETYPIPGSSKVGLGKTALDKIAAAAGISWIPERSGQIDSWNDPHRVKYRAVGEIRDFDGTRRVVYGEKEIDLRGEPGWPEEELGKDTREIIRVAEKARQKGGKARDPWKQILQQRQHIHSLAESKAKLRAIRAALAIPISMDRAEAAKPWVVPQLVPDLPMDDPEVRRMAVAAMLGAQAALYGPPPAEGVQARSGATGALEEGPAAGDETLEVEEMCRTAPETEPASEALDAVEEELDPWDDPLMGDALAPVLPVRQEVLDRIPVHDERRMRYLLRLNVYAEQLIEKLGAREAAAIFDKVAAGFDPLRASLEEIAVLGRALKDELMGGA